MVTIKPKTSKILLVAGNKPSKEKPKRVSLLDVEEKITLSKVAIPETALIERVADGSKVEDVINAERKLTANVLVTKRFIELGHYNFKVEIC